MIILFRDKYKKKEKKMKKNEILRENLDPIRDDDNKITENIIRPALLKTPLKSWVKLHPITAVIDVYENVVKVIIDINKVGEWDRIFNDLMKTEKVLKSLKYKGIPVFSKVYAVREFSISGKRLLITLGYLNPDLSNVD